MYTPAYKRYVALLLLFVYIFNQMDRTVFLILMEPLKRQFALSDTQIGFLAGPALVLLYSSLGIPVARWADRSHRVNIMSVAILIWSGICMLTAAAAQFTELSLARIGVGVGEAGFAAVALSVIGDYHDENERARAVAKFMMAIPIAAVASYLIGGWVNELWGWRTAFVAVGLPGLVLAFLLKFTVKEPVRRATPAALESQEERPSLRSVFSTLWKNRVLRHMAIGQGIANIVVNVMGWTAVFMIRDRHMETGEVGSWGAFAWLGSALTMWLGGYLTSKPALRHPGAQLRMLTWAALATPFVALIILWSPAKYVALTAWFFFYLVSNFFLAPIAALVQDLSAAGMRATMASVFIMVQMLTGGIIGVQLIGVLSDGLSPIAGSSAEALRWSMTACVMLSFWSAFHFWRGGRAAGGPGLRWRARPRFHLSPDTAEMAPAG